MSALLLVLLAVLLAPAAEAQSLQIPTLVELEQARRGNPLAAYAALLDLEREYRNAPQFAEIYLEMRVMSEEFLGMPDAGLRAMSAISRGGSGFGRLTGTARSSARHASGWERKSLAPRRDLAVPSIAVGDSADRLLDEVAGCSRLPQPVCISDVSPPAERSNWRIEW